MEIDFDKMQGLAPAVVQDAASGELLMVGFVNREALQTTMRTGFAGHSSAPAGERVSSAAISAAAIFTAASVRSGHVRLEMRQRRLELRVLLAADELGLDRRRVRGRLLGRRPAALGPALRLLVGADLAGILERAAELVFGQYQSAGDLLAKNLEQLSVLQYLLYAEGKGAVLVVLQGIDAGGKDGTIRHVMSGLNPQGVTVTPFKVPEGEEKRHDYLWRVHKAVPPYGDIGIFNRSHYEEVLVVRVHNLVPKSIWSKRYDEINAFERNLADNGVKILKFLLYISKDEQAKRFRERLDDKSKNWKFSPSDVKERQYWDDYIAAYDDMLRRCSTDYAPWYVVPANHKWFRNLAVSQVIVETLKGMDLKYPKPTADLSKIQFE